MARTIKVGVLCGALTVFSPTFGQELNVGKTASVSVGSAHEVVLAPERIRLQMLVRAESREAENANALHRKHQERVTKELAALGAISSSIEFTAVTVSVGTPGLDDPDIARRMARQQAAQLNQMRNNIPQQLRGQIPTPAAEDSSTELPQVYTATSALSAEWQLMNGLDEATILFPSKLRTAIEEKDFKGKKLKETLDPEEQALIQSLLGIGVFSNPARQPEIQMMYVGKLSDAQEEEAVGIAFKKAQAQAVMLAKASGRKLGAMRSISSNSAVLALNLPSAYSLNPYGQSGFNPMASFARKNVREVANEDPSNLKQLVSISVTFDVE